MTLFQACFPVLFLVAALTFQGAAAFQSHPPLPSPFCRVAVAMENSHGTLLRARSNKDDINDKAGTKEDMSPFATSVWYGVEQFGKIFGKRKESGATADDYSGPPASLQETMERIKLDMVERSYFLSGDMDTEIYDEQCEFADPFVSFKGRDRFVDNLSNLGSFITKYDAKLLTYNDEDVSSTNPTVETKLMVKLELNLPWKPVLAWPWGVTFEIDPDTYKVVRHIESWDIEPLDGIRQIFRKATVKI
jgi:hypothetical protein